MSLLGSNQNTTPLLHSIPLTQSLAGICIPIVYGQNRVTGNLLWFGDFNSQQPYQSGGKGLGKGGTSYEYYAAVLVLLCWGAISGIHNIWGTNGQLALQSTSEPYTVPSAGGSYTVYNAAAFNADQGVAASQPYSYTANDYGSPGPVTASGVTQVALDKNAGQYTQTGPTYVFPPALGGQTVTISYSYSQYTLNETEDDIIPLTSPFEITVQFQPQFTGDGGVIFVNTGVSLTAVGGSPTVSGTYNPNGGNYLYAPADAGKAIAINYTWQQSNSNVDPASTLNFTLLTGELGQAAWTYLTSNHLSQALQYSGLAMIGAPDMDLGQGAQMPDYNYEVVSGFQFGGGILDADLAVIIQDFLQNQIYGLGFTGTIGSSLMTIARNYWNANSFFISPILNASRPGAEIIEEWCEAGNTGIYWSEGEIKFIPYGDTTQVGNGYQFTPATDPVVDLNDDDFIADANEDPVKIDRTPWQDAFNEVKVQFSNRLNSYNPGSIVEQDDCSIATYGLRPEGQKDYSFICTIPAATFAANLRLKRLVNIRRTYSFRISGIRYSFLDPMDLVTLTDVALGLEKEPVRITQIEEDEQRIYTITAEEFPWGTATATIYPKQSNLPPPPPPQLVEPGATTVVDIFEPTQRVATTLANSPYQIWMALNGGPNWGGCQVWVSLDGSSYQQLVPIQTGPSRAGTLTASLPSAASPDTTNTLAVATSGQLFSVSLAQAQVLATLCKVGTEYLAYQNATLTGSNGGQTNNYNLTYLLRGAYSTPNVAHTSGESFIRLDSQIYQYSFDPSLSGKTIYFKLPAFNLLGNQQQALGDATPVPFTIAGNITSTNMIVDSVDAIGSATIRIYQKGNPVGTAGSATLGNGAHIALPAASQTGETLNTTYYVNWNPTSSAYVYYTNQNSWLNDQITNNYINIGSTTTPSMFTLIPLMGGGTMAIGAGTGAYGSSIPLPSGFSAANMLAWTTPCIGFDPSIQINGVLQSTASGGVLSSQYQYSIGGGLNASSNWTAAAWTAGAAITITTSGGYTYVEFTTANGDNLCVISGNGVSNAPPTRIPAGFSASQFVGITGMATTSPTGHVLEVINADAHLGLGSMVMLYWDGAGNRWDGNGNVFGLLWQTGGGVTEAPVSGTAYGPGSVITIPLPNGHSVGLLQTIIASGSSFPIPSNFVGGGLVTATSFMLQSTSPGGNISHGSIANQCAGTTYTGTMEDGGGHQWNFYGNILAVLNT
jgi:hypothetical protein